MVLVLANLVALAVLGAACMTRWSMPTTVGLALASAAWLPLNNGRLEGPVLVTLDPRHGLTASDLLAYLGFAVALWSTVRAHRGSRFGLVSRSEVLTGLAVPILLVGGLTAAYLYRN